jgi:VanZ family protein
MYVDAGCVPPADALNLLLSPPTRNKHADMLRLANRSRITTLSKLAFVLFWAAIFTGTHIPISEESLPPVGGDKVLHFGAYLGLSLLLATAWQLAGGVLTRRHLAFAWIAVIAYGAFDEVTQILVGRDCDIKDWLADAAGAAAGLLLFVVLRRLLVARVQLAEE